MVNEPDTLLREVNEELRREQLLKLWNAYGTYLIAAMLLFICAVGGVVIWKQRRAAANEAAGAQFASALDAAGTGKLDDVRKSLEPVISTGSAGYAALSRIRLAGVAARDGQIEEAVTQYDALATDASADALLRDFAKLQSASLKVGRADWTEVQNRLNDLMVESNPWRYSAREVAGVGALRAGRLDDARQALSPLVADPKVPPSIAERARAAMAMVAEAELAKAAPPRAETEVPAKAAEPVPAQPAAKDGKGAAKAKK